MIIVRECGPNFIKISKFFKTFEILYEKDFYKNFVILFEGKIFVKKNYEFWLKMGEVADFFVDFDSS